MGFVPVMWALWGASFVVMAGVSVYSSRLSKYEEDQLFLSESSSHVKSEQDAITERLKKFRPFKLTALGFVGATTLFVAGYYVLDVFKQFGK